MIVPGKGSPADPGLFSPSIGLQVMIGDASDSPYPSTSFDPVAASNAVRTSAGSGAPPEMHAWIDDRSIGCVSAALVIAA